MYKYLHLKQHALILVNIKYFKCRTIFEIYAHNRKNVKLLVYLGVTPDLSKPFLPHLNNKRLKIKNKYI